MAKTKISEFDVDPANNTDINSINIAEGCAPSGINNAIRQLMSDLKEFQTGASGDPFTVGGAFVASGTFAANGGATLGDASGDALTINSSAVSIPNGLNFDSNTLVIDATNNRVGVGTGAPAALLETNVASGNNEFRQSVGGTTRGQFISSATDQVIVNGGTGSQQFWTGGSERMRISSTGNVGIGTNAPGAKLDVIGSGQFRVDANGTSTPLQIANDATSGTVVAKIAFQNGGSVKASINAAVYNNDFLTFNTGSDTERMRIDSSGNVGIGTSSPSYQLDVQGSTTISQIRSTSTTSGNFPRLVFNHAGNDAFTVGGGDGLRFLASGTTEVMRITGAGRLLVGGTTSYGNAINAFGATQVVDSGGNIFAASTESYAADKGGQIMMGGKYRGLGDYASFGGFAAKKENGTDGNYAGYLQFLVSNVPSGNVERMRINSAGEVLIGVTSFADNTNGTRLTGSTTTMGSSVTTSRTRLEFNSSGLGTVGSITTNGSSTTYATSSDYRLKENITPMTGALAKVSALKPVTYTWKSNGEASQGFIAHELQAVVPECVIGEKDAVDEEGNIKVQGIDTSFLVATLTAAIQELKAEVDALKKQINQ
jgi:hypothetical protein